MNLLFILLSSGLYSLKAISQDVYTESLKTSVIMSDQERERRALHKKKVREKLYPGGQTEGELTIQPDLMTTKEKRKQEKEEREEPR
jgi:hypothetical protein